MLDRAAALCPEGRAVMGELSSCIPYEDREVLDPMGLTMTGPRLDVGDPTGRGGDTDGAGGCAATGVADGDTGGMTPMSERRWSRTAAAWRRLASTADMEVGGGEVAGVGGGGV